MLFEIIPRQFWSHRLLKECDALTCFYMVDLKVPVPLTALFALTTRILSVDGSPYGSATVLVMPTSSAHQVSLCCELPALHSCALDLLYATLCGVRRYDVDHLNMFLVLANDFNCRILS